MNARWDPLVALVVTVVSVVGAGAAQESEVVVRIPALRAAGLVLLVAACLSLVVRRRYPTVVAVLGASCAGTYFFLVNDNIAASIPAALGLYTLASQGYRARAVLLTVACTVLAVLTAVLLDDSPVDSLQRTAGRTGWMVAVMVAGEVTRHNWQNLRRARARARDAEHAREQTARRRAAEERLRIARELHDSLTHSISVINVQSSVALHMLPDRPEAAEVAVRHVKDASQDAMRELRATLQTLRISETDANPTLPALPRLLDGVSAVGIDVALVDESGDRLPSEVDTTAYRIVQEALTNVVRHSGAARTWVTLRREAGDLAITVVDDGLGTDGVVVAGYGIDGMRERVAALGGRLSFGNRPGGGFGVEAWLPVAGVEAAA
ncbi:histidine kinase [Stackebrandtia albiflava]